jgi:hypothetical protein
MAQREAGEEKVERAVEWGSRVKKAISMKQERS